MDTVFELTAIERGARLNAHFTPSREAAAGGERQRPFASFCGGLGTLGGNFSALGNVCAGICPAAFRWRGLAMARTPQPSLGGDCDNALGKAQRGRPTEMPLSQKGDCSEDATSYTSLNDGP
jgi:hypothetical protein